MKKKKVKRNINQGISKFFNNSIKNSSSIRNNKFRLQMSFLWCLK